MTTYAPTTMLTLAKEWVGLYKSAKFAGCVGDARHAARGGYHIGREYQPSDNYSVVRPDDRPGNGPDGAAAALDVNLNAADMVLCTKRLALAHANVNDPRRKYVNAFNGYTGSGDATRYDFYARRTEKASDDHKWHIHLEVRRKYVDSPVMLKAVLSILKGETVASYLASLGITPATVATVKVAGSPTRMPVAPPWPGKTYRRGDRAPGIAKWQKRMLDRGWYGIGKADGDFGPKTENVVRRWQAYCRISVDGAIGRVTWPLPWTKPLGG